MLVARELAIERNRISREESKTKEVREEMKTIESRILSDIFLRKEKG